MTQMINLREANQHLSKYIRSLKDDDEIIITRHGKAVAKLVAITEQKKLSPAQQEALQRLLDLNKSPGIHLGGQRLNREELHER